MDKPNPRHNSISLFRILNLYLLVIFHLQSGFPFFSSLGIRLGWYFSTFFFFIVSGYLLYSGFIDNPDRYKSGAAYTLSRLKRIYPYLIVSYVPIVAFRIFRDGLKETMYFIGSNFWEFLCLQGIGLNHGWNWFNNSLWFISVMLICGFILYHCLVKWHDTFVNFVLPLLIIVIVSYLFRAHADLSSAMGVQGFYGNFALLMGFVAMGLGIYSRKLTVYIQSKVSDTLPLRIVGFLLLLIIPAVTTFKAFSEKDFLYLFIDFVGISLCFLASNNRLFGSPFIQKWAGLTLYIYLAHMFWADYLLAYLIPNTSDLVSNILIILSCIVLSTIGGILLKVITDWLLKLLHIDIRKRS